MQLRSHHQEIYDEVHHLLLLQEGELEEHLLHRGVCAGGLEQEAGDHGCEVIVPLLVVMLVMFERVVLAGWTSVGTTGLLAEQRFLADSYSLVTGRVMLSLHAASWCTLTFCSILARAPKLTQVHTQCHSLAG